VCDWRTYKTHHGLSAAYRLTMGTYCDPRSVQSRVLTARVVGPHGNPVSIANRSSTSTFVNDAFVTQCLLRTTVSHGSKHFGWAGLLRAHRCGNAKGGRFEEVCDENGASVVPVASLSPV
jgi:hypothetical protein